jgi:transcriptional regulator with XRE-family HTH domain
MSDASVWVGTKEGMREYQQERLLLVVTEEICKAMKQQKVSRKSLAKRLGVSAGRVSQMLAGSNLTLRRVADMLTELGLMMTVGSIKLGAEESTRKPMYMIQECVNAAQQLAQTPCEEFPIAA